MYTLHTSFIKTAAARAPSLLSRIHARSAARRLAVRPRVRRPKLARQSAWRLLRGDRVRIYACTLVVRPEREAFLATLWPTALESSGSRSPEVQMGAAEVTGEVGTVSGPPSKTCIMTLYIYTWHLISLRTRGSPRGVAFCGSYPRPAAVRDSPFPRRCDG